MYTDITYGLQVLIQWTPSPGYTFGIKSSPMEMCLSTSQLILYPLVININTFVIDDLGNDRKKTMSCMVAICVVIDKWS